MGCGEGGRGRNRYRARAAIDEVTGVVYTHSVNACTSIQMYACTHTHCALE